MNNNNNIDVESGLPINNPIQANEDKQNPSIYILIRVMTIASLIAFGFITYLQTNQANLHGRRNILTAGNLKNAIRTHSKGEIIEAIKEGGHIVEFEKKTKKQILESIGEKFDLLNMQRAGGYNADATDFQSSIIDALDFPSTKIVVAELKDYATTRNITEKFEKLCEEDKRQIKELQKLNIRDILTKYQGEMIVEDPIERIVEEWQQHGPNNKDKLIESLGADFRGFMDREYEEINHASLVKALEEYHEEF